MNVHHLLLGILWLGSHDLSGASERCDDWGVDTMKHKPVYSGEPARIKCPLFQAFLKYNYSAAHAAGLTLIWYWIGRGQDLEEPINFRLPDNHISKEKDALWFRPALLNDTGNYTCMLRNATYCSKVALPLEVVHKDPGSCVSQAVRPEEVLLYLSYTNVNLTCPDVEGYIPVGVKPRVQWYMNCRLVDHFYERHPRGVNLTFGIVREVYGGDYTCVATYQENGRDFTLTRTLRVKVVGAPEKSSTPQIISPNSRVIYELRPGADLLLTCEVDFTFLKDSPQEVWWTIDGRNTDNIVDLRFNVTHEETSLSVGKTKIEKTLFVPKVTEKDLKRNYTCFAHNNNGTVNMQALVKLKAVVPRYTVELACGLGATVLLVVILTIVYHVYWLELVLFYRAHFGTDETILDGKEYDVYISYARNVEEEEFVLLTLRGVLENEFGYKLCIFDRDSLPGGIVTDETLSFIQRSRCLLVVLSPNYVLQGTQALLELKAGLENMASKGTIKVVLVQYQPIKKSKVKELRQAKAALSVIKWKGEKSSYPRGSFWKQLLVEMPVKKTQELDITEAIFDFIQRSRKMIVVLSPDYLLEKSISMLEFKLGLLCQNNIATKLVVVEYRPLSRVHPNVQQLKESVPFIPWKGEKSKRPGSKFWKALRLALPLRSLNTTGLSAWNESCSSHSDVSLDHVQRKRRRLKGPSEGQQSARPKGVPVQRGAAQPPRLKARDHAKPFLACRCCVAYCNENHKLGGHSPTVGKPKQEGQLHRTLAAGDPAGRRLQSSEKLRPPGSQVSALSLRRYADASNNNDFYVL